MRQLTPRLLASENSIEKTRLSRWKLAIRIRVHALESPEILHG